MKTFNKENLVYFLQKEENWGYSKFRKCVQRAYMDESIEKYIIGDDVVFCQGANRKAVVPKDIVVDILGIRLDLLVYVA